MEQLPQDSAMLLSYINTKLRDDYPQGLDSLCADMDISRYALEQKLGEAGFEYNKEQNRFW